MGRGLITGWAGPGTSLVEPPDRRRFSICNGIETRRPTPSFHWHPTVQITGATQVQIILLSPIQEATKPGHDFCTTKIEKHIQSLKNRQS